MDDAGLELGTQQKQFARYRSDKGVDEGEWMGGQGLLFVSAEGRAHVRARKGGWNGVRSVDVFEESGETGFASFSKTYTCPAYWSSREARVRATDRGWVPFEGGRNCNGPFSE